MEGASSVVAPGWQLPPDSTGKIAAAIAVTVNGQTVYVPATVLADGAGNEIGSQLLDALEQLPQLLGELRAIRRGLEILIDEELEAHDER